MTGIMIMGLCWRLLVIINYPSGMNRVPMVDALRNQFTGPSKKMIDTILVAQNQVKDGFLVAR